jgi:hypothetical protein
MRGSGDRCYGDTAVEVKPGFRSCDRQEARGATLPQQSRWVCASDRHRSAVLRADGELDRNDLREPKKTLKM